MCYNKNNKWATITRPKEETTLDACCLAAFVTWPLSIYCCYLGPFYFYFFVCCSSFPFQNHHEKAKHSCLQMVCKRTPLLMPNRARKTAGPQGAGRGVGDQQKAITYHTAPRQARSPLADPASWLALSGRGAFSEWVPSRSALLPCARVPSHFLASFTMPTTSPS